MAGSRKPNINVTRIKMSAPQGYVLGRTSPGIGPLELIPISGGAGNDIGAHLVAGGAVEGTGGGTGELGFYVKGPFRAGESFAGAPSMLPLSLPSATFNSSAVVAVAPTANFSCYLVNNLTAYRASGAPTGCLARIDFTAAAATGTFTWFSTRVDLAALAIPYIVFPDPFDITIADLTAVIIGDLLST